MIANRRAVFCSRPIRRAGTAPQRGRGQVLVIHSSLGGHVRMPVHIFSARTVCKNEPVAGVEHDDAISP